MKKFLLTYFISIIAIMGLMYGFILAVDPYDLYGINVFGVKSKAVASSRENKFNMLDNSKINYEAFIIGSSSAHRYETSVLKNLTGFETFNYAVQHTSPEDYIAIFNHITSKFKPKLIVLQVSFEDLDINHKTDNRLYASPLREYLYQKDGNQHIHSDLFSNKYLTLEAIRDSFRVIGTNFFGEIRHQYLEHGNYKKEKPVKGKVQVAQFSHYKHQLDPNRVEILKEIQTRCTAKGIDLVVISGPYSIEHYNRIMNNDFMKKGFLEYKKILKNIFNKFYDFTTEDVKDFNTTEYFRNSNHPSKKYSRMILEQIWSR